MKKKRNPSEYKIASHSLPGKNHSTPRKRMTFRAVTLRKDWRYIRRVGEIMQQIWTPLPGYSGEEFHWLRPYGNPLSGTAAGLAYLNAWSGGMAHLGSITPAISPMFPRR